MAWKKIIVSGSQAELNQITVDNTVTANAFSGGGASITGVIHNAGEIASEISGSLGANATLIRSLTAAGISGSFDTLSGSIATRFDGLTSDYTELTNIPNGIVSSSAQVVSNLIGEDVVADTFVGDGSGLTGIDVGEVATVVDSFTNQTSRAITHNFGTKNVVVTVYDNNDELFIPSSVVTTNDNVVTVSFDSSTSGRVIVGKGGHVVSGSIPFSNVLNKPTLVSGSGQIDYNSIQNTPSLANVVSGSSIASSAQGQVALTTNGVAATAIDLGLQTTDSPEFASLTLTGDLIVQGTTTSIQTANLLVEDKFILVNSGSSAADGGIVVNGAGVALGWDNDEGRWSLDSAGAVANQNTITTDAFIAGVVDIDAGLSDIAAYQKNGNIKTDSGEIYIYS